MAKKISYRNVSTIDGISYSRSGQILAPGSSEVSATLSAALEGILSTRTDANTGVITLPTGHGITSADTVGIGWTISGSFSYRYGVDVTAAGSTTIGIDVGTGADLPPASTPVVVFKVIADQSDPNNSIVPVSVAGNVTDWPAFLLGGNRDFLAILNFDDGPTTIVAYIYKQKPRSYITGMNEVSSLNCWNLLTGTGTDGVSADIDLSSIELYNFNTQPVNVDFVVAKG